MTEILELMDRYGIVVIILATLIINAKPILKGAGDLFAKLYPSWAKHRHQAREWERTQAETSYVDAVEALQALLKDARAEIKGAAQERRILQAYLLRHLSQYEQLASRTVAGMQDVSDVLREQNDRIAELTEALRQVNGHAQEIPPARTTEREEGT